MLRTPEPGDKAKRGSSAKRVGDGEQSKALEPKSTPVKGDAPEGVVEGKKTNKTSNRGRGGGAARGAASGRGRGGTTSKVTTTTDTEEQQITTRSMANKKDGDSNTQKVFDPVKMAAELKALGATNKRAKEATKRTPDDLRRKQSEARAFSPGIDPKLFETPQLMADNVRKLTNMLPETPGPGRLELVDLTGDEDREKRERNQCMINKAVGFLQEKQAGTPWEDTLGGLGFTVPRGRIRDRAQPEERVSYARGPEESAGRPEEEIPIVGAKEAATVDVVASGALRNHMNLFLKEVDRARKILNTGTMTRRKGPSTGRRTRKRRRAALYFLRNNTKSINVQSSSR